MLLELFLRERGRFQGLQQLLSVGRMGQLSLIMDKEAGNSARAVIKKIPGARNRLMLSDNQGPKQNQMWLVNALSQTVGKCRSHSLIVSIASKNWVLTQKLTSMI